MSYKQHQGQGLGSRGLRPWVLTFRSSFYTNLCSCNLFGTDFLFVNRITEALRHHECGGASLRKAEERTGGEEGHLLLFQSNHLLLHISVEPLLPLQSKMATFYAKRLLFIQNGGLETSILEWAHCISSSSMAPCLFFLLSTWRRPSLSRELSQISGKVFVM